MQGFFICACFILPKVLHVTSHIILKNIHFKIFIKNLMALNLGVTLKFNDRLIIRSLKGTKGIFLEQPASDE